MFAPLAGYKTYIAAIVAVASALVAALDGDMTWSAASAVITPALIGAALRHGLSSTLAAILPSVIDALAKAADGAKKTAPVLLAAILLASQLTACSPAQLAQVQTDITAGVAAACTDVATAAKINPTSPIVVYGEAACPLGVAASSLVQNSATIQWLGGIAAQIQATPATPAAVPAKS